MATELEQRLRDSLEHAAWRFAPPPDLRDRVDERLASHDRRRRTRRLAAAVVVVLVAAAGVVRAGGGGDDQRVAVVPSPHERSDGWLAATSAALGWRFEHPANWTVQQFSGQCRVGFSGTVVTNVHHPLQFEAPPNACTTSWDLAGVPDSFVAVEMSYMAHRPSLPATGEPDAAFPLSLDRSSPTPPEAHLPHAPSYRVQVTLGGDVGYRVMVWVGTAASVRDRSAVERIVASIRPRAEPPPFSQDRECLGTKAPPPPPPATFEVVGQPGNDWEVPVGHEGVTVALRATQRSETEVHELRFEIAPVDSPWPGSAIRRIPVETPLTVGANDLTVRWDGRDEEARRVSPGLYRFYASLTQTTYREVTCADGSGRGVERFPNSVVSAGLGTFVVQ